MNSHECVGMHAQLWGVVFYMCAWVDGFSCLCM